MNKEIEIHKKSQDLNSLIDFLNKNAKKVTSDEYQKDLYFTPAHRNFLAASPISEWLRIRKTKSKSIITYKNWKYIDNKTTNVAQEIETEISNYDNLLLIFAALNFTELVCVEKVRNSYMYKGAEISIDDVTNLGIYVDLENKSISGTDEEIVNVLNQISAELELSEAPEMKLGYPMLLLEKN